MAKKVLTSLDLNWLVLKGLRLENFTTTNLATALAHDASGANEGRIAYDSTVHKIKYRSNVSDNLMTIATEEWIKDNYKTGFNANEILLSSSYAKAATGSTNFTAGTTSVETAIASLAKAVDGKTNNAGTVTRVGLTVPTGFEVSGSPVTTSGTLALAFKSGYSLPTNVQQYTWDNIATLVSNGNENWDAAHDWVTANGDDVVLGFVKGEAVDGITKVEVVGLSTLSSGTGIKGLTIIGNQLCAIVGSTTGIASPPKYYSVWSVANGEYKPSTHYYRKGMCVIIGQDIYQCDGTNWELAYSGVDANVISRIEALEAYFSTAEDADNAINKWNEIVKFLENYDESDTLAKLIEGLAPKATTLAGYGITDAKIEKGVITLGSNTITPIAMPSGGRMGNVLTYDAANTAVWTEKKITAEKSYASTNLESVWDIDITTLGTQDVAVRLYEVTGTTTQPVYTEVIADVTVSKVVEERVASYKVRITFGFVPKSGKYRVVVIA